MRKFQHFVLLAAIAISVTLFASCSPSDGSVIDENGIPSAINDIMSPELIAEIEALGMPINRGANPPKDITGSYLIAPCVCYASSIINDSYGPGHQFADLYLRLYNQNNEKMTIVSAIAQSGAVGDGTGSYISGEGNKFSVYCPTNMTLQNGHKYKTINIYSGTITDEGIEDCFTATLMVSGGGIQWSLIEDGEGRVIWDSDGMSERTSWPGSRAAEAGVVNESTICSI